MSIFPIHMLYIIDVIQYIIFNNEVSNRPRNNELHLKNELLRLELLGVWVSGELFSFELRLINFFLNK